MENLVLSNHTFVWPSPWTSTHHHPSSVAPMTSWHHDTMSSWHHDTMTSRQHDTQAVDNRMYFPAAHLGNFYAHLPYNKKQKSCRGFQFPRHPNVNGGGGRGDRLFGHIMRTLRGITPPGHLHHVAVTLPPLSTRRRSAEFTPPRGVGTLSLLSTSNNRHKVHRKRRKVRAHVSDAEEHESG